MAMNNTEAASNNVLATHTSSQAVTRTLNGSHEFVIKGYSLLKNIGIGRHIMSEAFTVGGHEWAICFYPNGSLLAENNHPFVSVFVLLVSNSINVRTIFELTLLDQSGNEKHKVNTHFDGSLDNGPFILKHKGSMWGFRQYMRRTHLEAAGFLKDDCLKINCTVGVVVPSSIICSNTIQIPKSDIGTHFGMLLENGEGSDVTFLVGGERFHAHKLILGTRSTVFETKFFNGIHKDDRDIVVNDIEPKVFKALLHFIYRDTLIEDEEMFMPCSTALVSESLPAKLLAAAEKFGLPRLKLMCQSILCKGISIDSVGYILHLAHRYGAIELKSICLQFCEENFACEFLLLTPLPNSTKTSSLLY